jgi:hypothetical protein
MSPKRKQVLMRELRDLVFRACGAGGGVLGLLYGLHHWNSQPAECKGGSDGLAGCASHTLSAGIVSFLVPFFIGAIVGAVLGALLASQIRSRPQRVSRSRRAHNSPRSAPLVVGDDQKGEGGGHWLAARYPGRCDSCRATITPGDRIRHSLGRNVCEQCGAQGLA